MSGLCRNSWVLLAVGILVWPLSVGAQTRGRHMWSNPQLQGIRRIGGDLGVYGTSVQGLQRANPTGTGDLLRSNLGGLGSATLLRPGLPGAGTAPGMMGPPGLSPLASPRGLAYAPEALNIRIGAPSAAAAEAANLPVYMPGLEDFLSLMGGPEMLVAGAEPITSLVPTEPSLYKDQTERGDQEFRAGRYEVALTRFDLAGGLVGHSPESRLCQVHALFAVGEYYRAAHNIQRTLELFPELPLVQMSLRGFYGQDHQADFDEHLAALRATVDSATADHEEMLVLAYVLYFDGKPDEAKAVLQRGRRLSVRNKAENATEAIDTFLDNIDAATGAVQEPASQPAEAKPPEGPVEADPAGDSAAASDRPDDPSPSGPGGG